MHIDRFFLSLCFFQAKQKGPARNVRVRINPHCSLDQKRSTQQSPAKNRGASPSIFLFLTKKNCVLHTTVD